MYLDTLRQIHAASGSTKKISLLANAKNDEVLRTIIRYAYDPFKHFYVTKTTKDGCGVGTLATDSNWIDFFEGCSTRKYSGDTAKGLLEGLRKDLTKDDFEIVKLILKKDLRFGMAIKSINQAWPGFIENFGVMLASSFEKLTKPMYMSIKLDGLRGRLKGSFFTRNGHIIQGLDHLLDQIPLEFRHLDGELKVDGIDFDSGSGMIRSHSKVTDCKYNVFDLPDCCEPFKKRYERLQKIIPKCGPDIVLVKHVLVYSQEKVDETFAKVLAAGHEGLVLKDPDHYYEEKRSKAWQKIKDHDTIDAPIIGFFEGEGKLTGSLGGFIVELPKTGVVVRIGEGTSGSLTDDIRQKVWNNQVDYMGLTIEILFHQYTEKGSLRHPRMVKFRYDK